MFLEKFYEKFLNFNLNLKNLEFDLGLMLFYLSFAFVGSPLSVSNKLGLIPVELMMRLCETYGVAIIGSTFGRLALEYETLIS